MRSSTLAKTYGIKCGIIGNILGNFLGTQWEHIGNKKKTPPLLEPKEKN
jgi:hypothetical protein